VADYAAAVLALIIRKTRIGIDIRNNDVNGRSFANLFDLPPWAPLLGIPSLKPSCRGFPSIATDLDFLHDAIRTLKGAKSLPPLALGFEFRRVFHPPSERVF
jgi:hypothetical protein